MDNGKLRQHIRISTHVSAHGKSEKKMLAGESKVKGKVQSICIKEMVYYISFYLSGTQITNSKRTFILNAVSQEHMWNKKTILAFLRYIFVLQNTNILTFKSEIPKR